MPITPTNISKNTITPVGATKSSLSSFTNNFISGSHLISENSLGLLCENGDNLIIENLSYGMLNISKS